MPRRLRLQTTELGPLELFVIYEENGVWEESWRPLQGHPITDLFTRVSKEVYDHALLGYTKPLVDALGLSPEGCLRKLPLTHSVCAQKAVCPHFDKKQCFPMAKKMPWCFEPAGVDGADARRLAAEVVAMWRESIRLCGVHR